MEINHFGLEFHKKKNHKEEPKNLDQTKKVPATTKIRRNQIRNTKVPVTTKVLVAVMKLLLLKIGGFVVFAEDLC